MTSANINIFMATMSGKFPAAKGMMMRNQLEKMSDDKFLLIQSLPYRDPILILVVSLFIGTLGIDRFMLGQVGLGIVKLITMGGFGIWTVIDWFLVMGAAKEVNSNIFNQNAF